MDGRATRAALILMLAVAVTCSGCREPVAVEEEAGDWRFQAATSIVGTEAGFGVLALLTASNTTADTLELYWGGCPSGAVLRAYRTEDRSGEPVWDARAQYQGSLCTPPLSFARVPPGASAEIGFVYPVPNILGSTLPDGQYFFTVAPGITRPSIDGPELPAGDAVLTRGGG